MDPEDLREVISAYQKCVADTVQRFGGFVAKFMGDGVLIYFGYPQAHEDDAERAVRRSAVSWGFGSTPSAGSCFDGDASGSSAIAARILRRCPSETPIFSRSASVKWRSTETSISFSANRCAYCRRLSFSSQSAICCIGGSTATGRPRSRQFFQQRLRLLQIARVKSFRKPA